MSTSKKNNSSKKATQIKEIKSAKRNILTLLTVVFVALLIILTPVYFLFFSSEDKSIAVDPDKVASARMNSNATETRASTISQLDQSGALKDSKPQYSSAYNSCEFGQDREGWAITAWYQTCSERTVDLFETTLTRTEVSEKIRSIEVLNHTFGSSAKTGKVCDVLLRHGAASLIYFNFSVEDEDKSQLCKDLDFSKKTAQYYKQDVTQAFDPSTVDKSKKYIAIDLQTEYFKQTIGCNKTAFDSCVAPFKEPVTDF